MRSTTEPSTYQRHLNSTEAAGAAATSALTHGGDVKNVATSKNTSTAACNVRVRHHILI
jgi:hypothetical protein